MRQLFVQGPQRCGKTVLEIAKACDGTNLVQIEAAGIEQPIDLVLIHVSNGKFVRTWTQSIQTRLLQQGFNVTPLVEVTVLETSALN